MTSVPTKPIILAKDQFAQWAFQLDRKAQEAQDRVPMRENDAEQLLLKCEVHPQ